MVQDNDMLSSYLQSLYGVEPISMEEEHELAKRIATGDRQALDKLVRHNLRFVVYIARGLTAWQHSKTPVEDILSMGNEALFMAARSWQPTNESSFATFAKPWIERGIKRELNNTENLIRLPVNIMLDIKRLLYKDRVLSQRLGRDPTIKELAQAVGVSEHRILELQTHIAREPVYLNEIPNEEHYEEHYDE